MYNVPQQTLCYSVPLNMRNMVPISCVYVHVHVSIKKRSWNSIFCFIRKKVFIFFFLILISVAIFVDAATGNVWEIWGKLVNDWDNARKKTSLIKV